LKPHAALQLSGRPAAAHRDCARAFKGRYLVLLMSRSPIATISCVRKLRTNCRAFEASGVDLCHATTSLERCWLVAARLHVGGPDIAGSETSESLSPPTLCASAQVFSDPPLTSRDRKDQRLGVSMPAASRRPPRDFMPVLARRYRSRSAPSLEVSIGSAAGHALSGDRPR